MLVVRDLPGRVDLILTDLRLEHGMQGAEFCARVREEHPHVRVFIVTGDTRSEALPAGFPVIHKPFTAAILRERISELLRSPITRSAGS